MDNLAAPRLTLLSAARIESVHEASLAILSGSGLRVDSERAWRIYEAGGARVEGGRVFPSRELVSRGIETAPAAIDVFDRAGEKKPGPREAARASGRTSWPREWPGPISSRASSARWVSRRSSGAP